MFLLFISIKECQCIPWDMIRNDTQYEHQLCDSGGNSCFWEKMATDIANGEESKDCFCLGDCENVKYSQYATLKPSNIDECTIRNGESDWRYNSLMPIELQHQEALILPKLLTPMKNITDWYGTVDSVMNDYYTKLCENIKTKDKTTLEIRLEGPTFMTLKRSLRVTFADKLGSIGGTLGLFSGFSLLAIMELIHWICKIINSLIISKK